MDIRRNFFFPGTAMKTPSFDYPVVFGFFFSQKLIVPRIMENNHCDTEQRTTTKYFLALYAGKSRVR